MFNVVEKSGKSLLSNQFEFLKCITDVITHSSQFFLMKEEYKAAAFKNTFSQLLYLETKKLEPFSHQMTKDLTMVHGILSHGFEKYYIKKPLTFIFISSHSY